MDLQAATKLGGKHWNLVKLAALLCFVVAGMLMVVSLLNKSNSRAGSVSLPMPSLHVSRG